MKFNVYGDLNIRGITRPVVFEAEFLSKEGDAPAGRPIHFEAHTHIKRKDFKLGTGDWFDPISTVTDEILKISLEIKGLPKPS
jgi:polyisoprenoid-binding protein YceI